VNSLAGHHILVTGGAGFIGSHLVEHLVTLEPARLDVVDDLSTGAWENIESVADRVEVHTGDVHDPAVAGLASHADLVFHLAVRNVRNCLTDPAENFRVNADGTLAVLEAMYQGGRGRFVYVSSSEVYGIPDDGEFKETTVPAPTTVYGAGKLAGELVTLAYSRTWGMDTRVVRPFNNFGPRSHFEGDSGEVIPKFILRALTGKPLLVFGDGSQTRDFMFVTETARWLPRLAAVDCLAGDVVNIGSGREVRIVDLATTIIELTGSTSDVQFVDPRPGDIPRLKATIEKAERCAEFNLTIDLAEGLRATVDHFAGQDVEALLEREVPTTWK
jgi:UDP-glucose 4-epimerase